MTALREGQTLRREVRVYGVTAPCYFEMDTEGVSLTVKGCRKRLKLSWLELANNMSTPDDVPSKFFQRPYEFLQALARKK